MNMLKMGSHAAVAAMLATLAVFASATPASARPGICEYEYQARCVHWATTDTTCYHIYETSQPKYRKDACTIYVATGHVYVEG